MTLVFGVNNLFFPEWLHYYSIALLNYVLYYITQLHYYTKLYYYSKVCKYSSWLRDNERDSSSEHTRVITERIVCVDCRNKHCFSESNGRIPNEQVPSKLSNWSAGESMQVKENHFHVLSRSDYMVLTSFFYRPCALNGWYCQYRSGDFISHNISLYIKKLCWRVQ